LKDRNFCDLSRARRWQKLRTAGPAAGAGVVIRGARWRVTRAARSGDLTELEVSSPIGAPLESCVFLLPFDRIDAPAAGRLRRVRSANAWARIARLVATRDRLETPLAMLRARIDLVPHQVEPALAVLAGTRRLLIADEVGLGKTIQAGIVIAELLRRRPRAR